MSRFRSKPVEIEAFQFFGPSDLPEWFIDQMTKDTWQGGSDPHFRLETANGPVKALIGDWIIREPSGVGAYPCKPEVFAAKYAPLAEVENGLLQSEWYENRRKQLLEAVLSPIDDSTRAEYTPGMQTFLDMFAQDLVDRSSSTALTNSQ